MKLRRKGNRVGAHRTLSQAHSPTSISQNVICLISWHKQTLFEILTASIESVIDSWVSISRQLFKQRLKRSCFKVLLESLEGRKRTPWMLQLVFNKILTFPIDQFRVEKHGCGGSRKEGWGRPPSPSSINGLCFTSYCNMNTPLFRLQFEFAFLNYIVRSICRPCQR